MLCERDKTDESICSNHILFLWRLVLKILRMRNIEAKEFDSVYKKWLCGYLHKMENEKCLLIIHDAMRNKLFTSVKKEIK